MYARMRAATSCLVAYGCLAIAACVDQIPTEPTTGIPVSFTLTPALDTSYHGPGYDLGVTHYQCVTDLSEDEDGDGLNDACENALALAFEPSLRVFTDEDPSREPTYAVTRTESQVVRIAYLLAYHRDMGTPGIGPDWVLWKGHSGDTEFIIVNVVEDDNVWMLQSAFLSAHYEASWIVFDLFNVEIDRSGWVAYDDLSYADNTRGRPKVWTAWGKHANYASLDDCEAHPFDLCSKSGHEYWDDALIYLGLLRNIGHGTGHLMDCEDSLTPGYYQGEECFWDTGATGFKGWYTSGWGDIPGPYRNTLYTFGFGGSAPPATPSVWIQGELQVRSNANCFWNAMPSGGTSPYTYEWYRDTTLVGTSNGWGDDTGENDFFLTVIVSDVYGKRADATAVVEVDGAYDACQER